MRVKEVRMRMTQTFSAVGAAALIALALAPANLAAQTKPKNATGQCKDGTYTTAKSKEGACSSHGGVTTWYADTNIGKSAAQATKDGAATAGKATADVAKTTGEATKDAGKATAGAATTGAKSAASATKKGIGAVTGSAKTATKPSDAPAAATGKCKDGTYTEAKEHSGACSKHGGVAAWYQS
jgi:hypothetical protein